MMDTRANEGRWSVALTYTAEWTNKINDGFGIGCTSAVGSYLPVTNSRLLEARRVACQQTFVNFADAAKTGIARPILLAL